MAPRAEPASLSPELTRASIETDFPGRRARCLLSNERLDGRMSLALDHIGWCASLKVQAWRPPRVNTGSSVFCDEF